MMRDRYRKTILNILFFNSELKCQIGVSNNNVTFLILKYLYFITIIFRNVLKISQKCQFKSERLFALHIYLLWLYASDVKVTN